MEKKGGIDTSFTNYLRKASKLHCPVPGCDGEYADIDDRIRRHLQSQHQDLLGNRDIATLVQEIKKGNTEVFRRPATGKVPEDPGGGQVNPAVGRGEGSALSPYKRRKSPDSSIKGPERSVSPQQRSRARPVSTNDSDFRRSTPLGKLWSPDDAASPSSPRPKAPARPSRNLVQHRSRSDIMEDGNEPAKLLMQPETRPIGQDQLVAEVKGIYAGLVMVESKCIEVDNAQSSTTEAKLNHEQWQALIALHRTLLHEHHDFFLASQHPSANQALRRLAGKYAMPARMWRHGIHSFLELLRHRLPGSLEHMLTFIYLAYSMMALLYETVPAFEETWIECLGDLGRYRMAIEDDDIRDREIWTSVSRLWYSKASDKAPTTGRLYHHLAILARPNALQQLFYYTKSLCVPVPFPSARESIQTLFDPILNANSSQSSRLIPIDTAFVKAHGILFSKKSPDDFFSAVDEFLGMLDDHIDRSVRRWMESGYYIGISNCCSLLSYGQSDSVILRVIRPQNPDEPTESSADTGRNFEGALKLADGTYNVVFRRLGDVNILPFLHVVMVFMYHLTHFPSAMAFVEKTFPWKLVSLQLNSLLQSYREHHRIYDAPFPRPDKEPSLRPLPEDFAMKGLVFVDKYFPNDWFSNDKVDDDEKYFEVASMTDERKERILWLGCRIAKSGKWLTYDETLHKFGVPANYEMDIDNLITTDMMNISETADAASRASTFNSDSTIGKTPSWASGVDDDMMDIDEAPASKPIIQQ
ncbi:hypothetical protein F5B20DRAFT_583235 [Whalleya microplaca]|nr:hypothetical protein F5B20DRAFT_583235 [Whalleya microplaca]